MARDPDRLARFQREAHVLRSRRVATRPGRYNRRVDSFQGVPGADLIADGLRDLAAGVESAPALLVSIGAPRLRELGVDVPAAVPAPEHRLYAVLADANADSAHSQYNALVRRLVSFERALACGR